MIVGIDFGTCYSSVAIMVNTTPFTDFIKDPTGLGIPSQYLRVNGKDYFGDACESGNFLKYRGKIINKMKKTIRLDSKALNDFYRCDDLNLSLRQIIAKYINYLITEAQKAVENDPAILVKEIEEIAIAAPVGTDDNHISSSSYRTILKEIIKEILPTLNENNIHVIDEPAAAAISYLYSESLSKTYKDKQTALVFDLGGGTLDICVVEHNPVTHNYTIMVPDGYLDLGGDNWDASFKKLIESKIGKINLNSEEKTYDFYKALIKSKIELSKVEETMFVFNDDGLLKSDIFTRKEFEQYTIGELNRAMDLFNKVINNYEPGIESIDKIVLVGGSSNMPQIRARIIQELGSGFDEGNIIYYDPSKAIAKGAAIHAMMEASTDFGERDQVIGSAKQTYGVTEKRKDSFGVSNIIYKDMPLESNGEIRKVSEGWHAIRNDQTSVRFEVYESNLSFSPGNEEVLMDTSKGKPRSNMTFWVPVPEQYLGCARKFKFNIEMVLDSNGILKIIARDLYTGKELAAIKDN